jgi:hypothetical protein
MSGPVLPVARTPRRPLKDRLDDQAFGGRQRLTRIPIPRHVPMNTFVPGTIALSFFTHRTFVGQTGKRR